MTPIGILRSPFGERMEAPRQAPVAEHAEGRVELFAGHGYEDALLDLSLFDHLWLLVLFDRNVGYRPKVLPPRSSVKRGVFATRSPYRPNPIGLSAVQLVKVEGLTIHVRGLDLLDGTPVLDVKPYIPYSDAIPGASHGWLDQESGGGERPLDPLPEHTVVFEPSAQEQLRYLRESCSIDLEPRIEASLRLGPTPHAYRRIRRTGSGYQLALKDWRIRFSSDERTIRVHSLHSGYRPQELFSAEGTAPEAHRLFTARWGTLPP